jgi:chemotaxis protein histidine kinase CheA
MRLARRLALAAAAILAALALIPATAAAAGEPIISEGSASELDGEITIEAQIDPEGLATSYEILLECPSHETCQHTEGTLPAIAENLTVQLVLADPQAGKTYTFTVSARNADGQTSGSWRFKAPQPTETLPVEEPIPPGAAPEGAKDKEPYTPPPLPWANESGNEAAARTVAEQRAKEHEEQQAKEAAEQHAAALKHTEEQAQQAEAEAQQARQAAAREEREHPACRVPALKGDTLTAARHALANAHCRLGAIYRPDHHHGTMYVSAQGAPAGERLAHGARVALWCGAKRASRR